MKASKLSSWILAQSIGKKSIKRKFMRLIRRAYLKLFNPPTRGNYFGREILFPARHDLVYLTSDLPFYNTQLRRLADHMRRLDGDLRFLDIGANIGDGVVLVGCEKGDAFWLVEGSPTYLPYLEENINGYSNVKLIKKYLSNRSMVVSGGEVTENATARIDLTKNGSVVFDTLDSLFCQNVDVGRGPNLLKIDIEGHEPKVFDGGRDFFEKYSPVIFIEWFPALLKLEGGDPVELLTLLCGYGYVGMIVYDNIGCLYGMAELRDVKKIQEMLLYAELRGPHYYFDLILFKSGHASVSGDFYQSEVAFYRQCIRA